MKAISILILSVFCLSLSAFSQSKKPHKYSDEEIIKLSEYIKELEEKDSLYNKMKEEYEALERERNELRTKVVQAKEGANKDLERKGEITLASDKLGDYSKNVMFDVGSASLRPEANYILDGVADILKISKANFVIEGHTDITGPKDVNMRLSEERAKSIKNYLVKKGIDASRLSTKGLGPDKPVASNDTEEGRAQNRRVVIKIAN